MQLIADSRHRFTLRLMMIFACAVLKCAGQADNRYCAAGNQAEFGDHDGPAALPQSCFYTPVSATPSSRKIVHVAAGANLQQAIDEAKCGDTVELAAEAEFRGNFNFPAKGCDDAHWITVETDGKIVPEGTRISPCYAGVATMPGRPQFACPSPSKAMATLVVPPNGKIKAADHYRLIGLEITRQPGGIINALVMAQNASKLIFDRVWMHGNDSDETQRGIAFPGGSFIAVIDSYFSDFHCTAVTGSCTDSQALWAGTGDMPGGVYKIVDNFLEASGENILMGGGGASVTPSDLEIRRNEFYKPLIWNTSQSPRFIARNNFELKNGTRVLVEGNLFENSWGGFSQSGFQLLLTPKNQSNVCPSCIVRDVTIRYCLFRHSGAGMQLASVASDSGGLSRGLMNVSIHDLVLEDINGRNYAGNGMTFQISASPKSILHDISIRHVTVPVSDRQLFVLGADTGAVSGMVVVDNILGAGQYQMMSTGGHWNCAYQRTSPKDFFDACWPGYQIAGNLIVGGRDRWPDGNRSIKDLKSLGLSAEATQLTDWKLPSRGQYPVKTTDGKDPGADIERVQSSLADQ